MRIMREFQKKVFIVMILSYVVIFDASGTCFRCAKIEEERAKEQASHPETAGYYDDEQPNKSTSRKMIEQENTK